MERILFALRSYVRREGKEGVFMHSHFHSSKFLMVDKLSLSWHVALFCELLQSTILSHLPCSILVINKSKLVPINESQ